MEKILDGKVENMKLYLERNFGIKSELDLKVAVTKMPKLNMGIFVIPVRQK